ncbi:MAG: hypothetical protein IKQ97_10915 [Eubacterium sp.]|nr:hypothetical protein [Eubacterium sp.]
MASSIRTLKYPLINRYSRQIFDVSINQISVRFMYDSGARIPVWCSGEKKFLSAFPKAICLPEKCRISGFGKGDELSDVFMIPRFELESDDGVFVIERLIVAMMTKPQIGSDFIISETMLSKVDSITYRRELKELHLIGEEKPFRCTAMKNGKEIIDISIWSQDSYV